LKLATKSSNNIQEISPPVCESTPDFEFLRKLVAKGILDIKPSMDKVTITYPDLKEHLEQTDFISTKFVLDSLLHEGLLKEKSRERILVCPKCTSPDVRSKFSCPRCNSESVELTQLLEHTTCGYIGSRIDFSKCGQLVCPRCNTDLSQDTSSYRSIGNFYRCEECENRFDKPEVVHICQNCGKMSSFKEIKYPRISVYRISDDVVNKYMSELPLLESLRFYLSEQGFVVRLQSEMNGVSGAVSHFDLIAEKGKTTLVIDTSLQGNKSDLIAFLAKKIDVNPTKALLLDLSGGSELPALGKIYGIDVLAVKGEEISKELQAFIDNLTDVDRKKTREG
jgi:hypothetical protein